jgi:hypothetical protein
MTPIEEWKQTPSEVTAGCRTGTSLGEAEKTGIVGDGPRVGDNTDLEEVPVYAAAKKAGADLATTKGKNGETVIYHECNGGTALVGRRHRGSGRFHALECQGCSVASVVRRVGVKKWIGRHGTNSNVPTSRTSLKPWTNKNSNASSPSHSTKAPII